MNNGGVAAGGTVCSNGTTASPNWLTDPLAGIPELSRRRVHNRAERKRGLGRWLWVWWIGRRGGSGWVYGRQRCKRWRGRGAPAYLRTRSALDRRAAGAEPRPDDRLRRWSCLCAAAATLAAGLFPVRQSVLGSLLAKSGADDSMIAPQMETTHERGKGRRTDGRGTLCPLGLWSSTTIRISTSLPP
jgi:hypothetical protein